MTPSAEAKTGEPDGERLTAPVLLLIGLCALVYFLDGLIHSILGPLAPDMARSLSLSNSELGPIFSANLVGQCIGLVVFPVIASRIGQRAVVIIAVAGFGIAQCATVLADGATSMVVWRLIVGVFLGACLPSCLALVTTATPIKRRGLGIMMLFTGYGLGATVAGLVATAFGGWRMAMIAVGVICLFAALAVWLWLQEPRAAEAPAQPDAAASNLNPFQILAPRYAVGTLMLWLLFICMLTMSYCLNSWLPTLLVEVGRDPQFAALSVSTFSFGGIVAALGVGVLIDKLGATRTLVSFLVMSTVLLLVIGNVLATASGTVLMILLAMCGFFILGAYGGVNVVLASFYPDALRAIGIGWAKSIGRLGTVIAPVIIGIALSAGIAQTTIMSLFAVPAIFAMLSLLVIAMASRRSADTALPEPVATAAPTSRAAPADAG